MTERILSEVLELDVDRCENDYGVSPCTAGRLHSGTAQAGSADTLTLAAGASAVDDAYNGKTIRLTDGTGRERRITDYVGATKVATVASNWPINQAAYSEELDNAYWSKTANVTANDALGLDGANSFETVEDDNAAGWETVNRSGLVRDAVGSPVWFGCHITKDAVAAATRFGLLRLGFTGAALNSQYVDLRFATDTGAIFAIPQGPGAIIVDSRAEDLGTHWFFWISGYTADAGWASTRLEVYPAVGASAGLGSYNNAITGSMGVGGIHYGQGAAPTAYIKTDATAITLPDASTTYDIIDRRNACYRTYRTCQDRPNYVKGTHTLRFTGRGAPIDPASPARPWITALAGAPTELDLEECVSRRAMTTATLVDAPDSDVELDPYILDRATPAGGTFWRRFFARVLAYAGREARVKRGFVEGGVFGAYTTERYIWESAAGPDGRGDVRITLKDPIKLLDRGTVPLPTSGKLALDLGLNDLQLTLGSGEGAQYAASGWVRVGDEVIRYSGNSGDVLSWPNGTYRAVFGTEASEADAGDGVQQCYVVEDAAFADVVEELHNLGGIDSADLDLTLLASEAATWLGDEFRIRNVCITDPESVTDLLKELMRPAGMVTWWAPIAQKVQFKVVAPASPADIVLTTLDDSAELIENSVSLKREEDLRVTLAAVNFARVSATAEQDEAKSYRQAEIAIDADAESANEYNERRVLTISSRFYGPLNTRAMRTFVQRYVARHRDAPERIEFHLDPKDGSLTEGTLVDVQTYGLVDAEGQIRTARVLVLRRDAIGTMVRYAGRITNFDRPYAFIAPNGTGDYPNHDGYAVISDNNGLMSDGTPGSLII